MTSELLCEPSRIVITSESHINKVHFNVYVDPNGRQSQLKTTLIEDNLKGRGSQEEYLRQPQWKTPQWKTNLMEDNLYGRQPQWKTNSMEENLNGRKTSMEDNLNGR